MDKPSKTFSRAGFYLILLFSFFAPVSPAVAHIVAVSAFTLWIVEQLIFRNTDWIRDRMFFPVAGFIIFTLLAFFVARLNSSQSVLPYTGYLAIFYFVVQRFVSFSEKRKMIIWTFIAGVILSSAVDAILRFSRADLERSMMNPASQKISFFILIVFALILAFYSEGKNLKEKLFFGLLSLPLIAVAILTLNIHVILILLFFLIIIGVAKDRTALLPLGILIVIFYSGIFDTAPGFSLPEIINILKSRVSEIIENSRMIENIAFFGMSGGWDAAGLESRPDSFFIRLLASSGPPAILLFLWILVKQLRSDFVKFRKIAFREMKAFHLGIVLAIASFVLLSLFGSVFESGSAILIFWMILGMSEI
ncbi:MAG: hypothetical protein JSW64_05065 [Candidatus Zixiibacteriota bacterium]|nr:MAG: hypothetical protein JSW64_05065 [candidate division Zixibacteria bacterium]